MSGKRNHSSKNPAVLAARQEQAAALSVKGVPQTDIAMLLGVSKRTVVSYLNSARQNGILQKVQDRLLDSALPQAVKVYEEILNANPDELTQRKIVKAQELRLRAARDIAQGTGALRAKVAAPQEKIVDLDGYYQLREARRIVRPESERHDTNRIMRGSPAADATDADLQGRGDVDGDGGWNRGEELVGFLGAGGDQAGEDGSGSVASTECADLRAPVDERRDGSDDGEG